MDIIQTITEETHLSANQVHNVVSLLDDGNTIPFIARYRKEKTEGLDEVQIRSIRDRYEYITELEERKTVVLKEFEDLPATKEEIIPPVKTTETKLDKVDEAHEQAVKAAAEAQAKEDALEKEYERLKTAAEASLNRSIEKRTAQKEELEKVRQAHEAQIEELEMAEARLSKWLTELMGFKEEFGDGTFRKELSELRKEAEKLEKEIAKNQKLEAKLLEKKKELTLKLKEFAKQWQAGREKVSENKRYELDILIFGHPLDANANWRFHHVQAAYELFEYQHKRFFRASELLMTGSPDEKAVLKEESIPKSKSRLFFVASLQDCVDTNLHNPGDERQLVQEGTGTGEPRYVPTFWAIGLMVLYKKKSITKAELLTLLSDTTFKDMKRIVTPKSKSIELALTKSPFGGSKYATWKRLMFLRNK